MKPITILRLIIALFLAAGLAAAVVLPRGEGVLGSYRTSLEGRTPGQRQNAGRAARALDGRVIEAGEELSFNKTVGGWTPDRGYVRAPVSYDGELVVDWGGGVCQTSTTLYNAALLAGLEIVERNRHAWAPKYVPPGRDAAVAQVTIDLRLRNPYPWPVRIRARVSDAGIGFDILGRGTGPMAEVHSVIRGAVPPIEVIKPVATLSHGQRRLLTRGRPGARVAVYRTRLHGPGAGTRELVSQDTYPAMNRVVAVGE